MTLVGKDGDGKVPAQQPKWLERETSFFLSSFCDLFQVATVRPSSFSSGNADNIVVSKYTQHLVL